MNQIFSITEKDLRQMVRDRKTFMFLLIMPIAFTLLFGMAFKTPAPDAEGERLPVGVLNQDEASPLSLEMEQMLESSQVMRLEAGSELTEMEAAVAGGELAGALIIPQGYDAALRSGAPLPVQIVRDPISPAGISVQNEIQLAAGRVAGAAQAARAIDPSGGETFAAALEYSLAAWQNPPVRIAASLSGSASAEDQPTNPFARSSPGMSLQFAIAGLLTCAQVIVTERKTHCLARLLTTSAGRSQVLLGHFLAIFVLILAQLGLLIVFGQLALGLDYFAQPLATLLTALGAALCIAALGLLIGVLAKGEEQAISFSLIAMFLLSGLGGAWMPLEATGPLFQSIGRMTPLAWAMEGFQNILIYGKGLSAVWLPAAAMLGYAGLFFLLARWRFRMA